MMKRWLYHYEIKHALIRLLTLIVVSWCMSGILNSAFDASDPIKSQMTICFILLLLNIIKLTFASSPKYSQKIEDVLPTTRFNMKSTAFRILLLPLLAVMGLSAFLLSGQMSRFLYNNYILLMNNEEGFQLDNTVSPSSSSSSSGSGLTILVLIMSSWTIQGAEKRQLLRDSTLHWMGKESDTTTIIYRFVVGQPPSARIQSWMGPKLVAESEKYHDLLVVQAPDNPPLDKSKKLYEAIRWASSSVRHDYLVKTDDDVFVRWDVLRKDLLDLGPAQDNYWSGFVYR